MATANTSISPAPPKRHQSSTREATIATPGAISGQEQSLGKDSSAGGLARTQPTGPTHQGDRNHRNAPRRFVLGDLAQGKVSLSHVAICPFMI